MEKLIYALWKPGHLDREAFNATLRGELAEKLKPLTKQLRLNLRDAAVDGGDSPNYEARPPAPDAVVQFWLNTAYPPWRAPIDAAIESVSGRVAAWLVCESVPLPNNQHPPQIGKRTEGFAQMAFIFPPEGVPHDAWRSYWQDGFTEPAMAHQTTFEYIQNYVVRPLLPGTPEVWSIAEEGFPIAALTDRTVYFKAPGDAAAADANAAAMLPPISKFIGPNGCDVFPTSQYQIN